MVITLFYITNSDQEKAAHLGRQAIEQKLAGCANIFDINSIFPWESEMQHEEEVVLVLKTIPDLKESLREFISRFHHYEVPCIISWDVEVNDSYGRWIKENVSSR